MAKKPKFDVMAFVKGVGRPTDVAELCTDAVVRTRIDNILGALKNMPKQGGSLAGDPARKKLVAELKEHQDNAEAWTRFTIQAPSNATRIRWQAAMASVGIHDEDSEDGDDSAGDGNDFADRVIEAQIVTIAECVTQIGDNPVHLSEAEAAYIVNNWPDSLTAELVDRINSLTGVTNDLPLSQRLSETLQTRKP